MHFKRKTPGLDSLRLMCLPREAQIPQGRVINNTDTMSSLGVRTHAQSMLSVIYISVDNLLVTLHSPPTLLGSPSNTLSFLN